MSRRRESSPQYDPPEVRQRIDNENSIIWTSRFENERRARTVALREAAQDHERKAAELRKEIGDYFQSDTESVGAGGEVVPDPERTNHTLGNTIFTVDIADIDALQETASRFRLEALAKADAFAPGVDLAESMEAQNSLEKMLCHQMAVAHALALRLASKATSSVYQVADWVPVPKQQAEAANAARLAGASAKLMQAYSRGAEALHKLRGGNPQQIIVQHIHMDGNAQAVISGNADARGRGKRK